MFKRLLDFEIKYQTRQIGFWVVLAVMVIFGALTVMFPEAFGSNMSGSRIKANGSQMVARGIVSAFLPIIFFGGVFTVTGILRDKTSNMLEIVHATPVSTRDMTLARMAGIFGIVTLAIFAFLLTQFVAQFSPNIDSETLGPIRPQYYLQPFLVFSVVNALFVTAFFTLIAGLTQNRVLVLVSAIGLFFWTLMTGLVTELDVPKWFQATVDPFGSLAYEMDTDFWSTDERNSRLLSLNGYVGLNRLVWGVISIGTLALVFNRFKRGLVTGKTKRSKSVMEGTGLAYTGVAQKSGFIADIAALITRTKFEFFTTVRSVPFAILASLAAAFFALLVIITVFFSPQKLIPTSLFMSAVGFASLLIPMILIISFFSAEMVFRDKGAKFNELLDSTNVSNWPLMVGKWLALMGVVTLLCTIGMFIGMFVQLVTDSPPINLGIYLKFTFLNQLPNYLFLASLAMIVQIFVPNRIVGMLAAAGAIIGVEFFLGRLPFYHPLLGFGGRSPGALSEISPYGNWISFRWFNFYWLMFVTAYGVLGVWLWRRGLQTGIIHRFNNIGSNISKMSAGIMALAIVAFFGAGAYIYKAYDAVDYSNRKAQEAQQVKGEKLFASERDLPRPHTRAVKVDVQIYPKKQEALIKGTMELQNSSGEPINELYVQVPTGHEEDMRVLTISGATNILEGENAEGDSVKDIRDFNVNLFKFEPPLADGARTTVTYETFYHAPRLADGSNISKNGTFLNNYGGSSRVVPIFGPPDLAIQSSNKRRKLGLEELPKWPDPVAEGTELNLFGLLTGPADMIDLEARVCTDAPQTPIAPGNLVSEEKVGDDRICRTYKTDQPISNFFSMLSGEYTVTEDSWDAPDGRNIPIRVYHAEQHDYSVDTMIKATQFSLEHFTEHFAPYQYDYVRILEVPFIGFAQAYAGTIPYAEQGFIMSSGDPDDIKTLDNAMQTTMHEMGHQWFAHQIVPGFSRGFNVLSEGLTSYAAMDAYEAYYGWDKARYSLEKGTIEQMVAMAMFDSEKEVPLAMARNQQYLVYQKADWVLWSLKNYIGPQNLRDAMKGFLDDYGLQGPPYPTTKTLTNVLRDAAGPEYDQLITDQWDRVVWWKYSFDGDGPSLTETADGKWRVTFTVKTDKDIKTEEMETAESWADIDGEVLNEPLEIGVYSEEPKKLWSAWTELERVWITEAEQTITLELDEKPSYIAIDPRRLMLERNVDDNVQSISESSAFAR
ncbi:MAG: M1 family aminopeptidase [Litorimonas sp.]